MAEHGYDRDKVREAFDSFYRHIAQLDSTLRALEAVEVFRDQAGELRRELRALKAAGWTQQPWPTYGSARPSPGLPESLPRFAIEAVFLIAVAVVVAVAGFDRLSIVLVMGLAWAIVGVVEWASSRDRFARKPVPPPVRAAAEPAPAPLRVVPIEPAARAEAWEDAAAGPAAESEEAEEELTVVGAAARQAEPADSDEAVPAEAQAEAAPEEPEAEELAAREAEVAQAADGEPQPEPEDRVEEPPVDEPVAEAEPDEPVAEPDELVAEADPDEPVAEAEPAASPWSWAADPAVERTRAREEASDGDRSRRPFWRRRKREEDGYRFDPTQPRHVRVLPPAPSFDEQFPVEPDGHADPWEEELDLSIEEPEGPVEPDAEREPEPAYAESRPDGDPVR